MPTVAETIKKVNEFAELPAGWHFGEGMPPSVEFRDRAISFLQAADFMGVQRANAFPGVSGQVQITFYHAERMLELTLERDGSITIAEDEGDREVVFKEEASEAEAFTSLWEFSQHIWATSESSIESITTQNVNIFPAWRSTSAATNLYPSFTQAVPRSRVIVYVDTWHDFIVSRLESRRFTGAFPTILFPHTVASGRSEVPLAMIATTTSTVGRIKKREEPYSH